MHMGGWMRKVWSGEKAEDEMGGHGVLEIGLFCVTHWKHWKQSRHISTVQAVKVVLMCALSSTEIISTRRRWLQRQGQMMTLRKFNVYRGGDLFTVALWINLFAIQWFYIILFHIKPHCIGKMTRGYSSWTKRSQTIMVNCSKTNVLVWIILQSQRWREHEY